MIPNPPISIPNSSALRASAPPRLPASFSPPHPLSPPPRLPPGAKNAYRLWQRATSPDSAFVSFFPPLGVPFTGSPLPSSQVISGDVWALDIKQPASLTDDQARSINRTPITASPYYLFPD